MLSKAKTVKEYLKELSPERRKEIQAIREVILANLDEGYEEGMQYGMIGYYVPHSVFPAGYHCDPKQPLPFAGIGSRKNYISMYLGCIYSDSKEAEWFRKEWVKTGKKLDMGKACIRCKKLEDIPLELVGRTIARTKAKDYIAFYELVSKSSRRRKADGR